MERLISAQELYDEVRTEILKRDEAKGLTPHSEVEIFKVVVMAAREAVEAGDAPPEFLKELEEVRPAVARQRDALNSLPHLKE